MQHQSVTNGNVPLSHDTKEHVVINTTEQSGLLVLALLFLIVLELVNWQPSEKRLQPKCWSKEGIQYHFNLYKVCTVLDYVYDKPILAFTIVALVIGPSCLFQYQLNSLGGMQSCSHHRAGNYSKSQAITIQSGNHSLLGRESAHTGEVPYSRTQRHTAATKTPHLRPLDPKWWAVATAPRRPVCIWSIYSDIGALRLVTAREFVFLRAKGTWKCSEWSKVIMNPTRAPRIMGILCDGYPLSFAFVTQRTYWEGFLPLRMLYHSDVSTQRPFGWLDTHPRRQTAYRLGNWMWGCFFSIFI